MRHVIELQNGQQLVIEHADGQILVTAADSVIGIAITSRIPADRCAEVEAAWTAESAEVDAFHTARAERAVEWLTQAGITTLGELARSGLLDVDAVLAHAEGRDPAVIAAYRDPAATSVVSRPLPDPASLSLFCEDQDCDLCDIHGCGCDCHNRQPATP